MANFAQDIRKVVYPVPAPDPHGLRTGSQQSIIRWHLNLPHNAALTLL